MFLIGAINILRISAADSLRIVKFELLPPEDARRSNPQILDLLERIDGMGPAFCQMAIDRAADIIASIKPLHRVMPVVQERHADNLATMLAGFWVAQRARH